MKLQDVVDYVFGSFSYYQEFMEDVMIDVEDSKKYPNRDDLGLYGMGFDGVCYLAYRYFGSNKSQSLKLYDLLLDTVDDYLKNEEKYSWIPEKIPTVTRGRKK